MCGYYYGFPEPEVKEADADGFYCEATVHELTDCVLLGHDREPIER